ncbi:C39 family peptidase [Verrucomicrobiaceae bacterium R5-34]|nr:C39 family peptidase [Verrucomicrobiaceae bacterium R5-34]
MIKAAVFSLTLSALSLGSVLSATPARDLDILFMDAKMWDQPIAEVLNKRSHLAFRWLSKEKRDARSNVKGLQLWSLPVGETILRSQEGKLHSFEVSIYNRGDMGVMKNEDFKQLTEKWHGLIAAKTGIDGEKMNRTQKGSVVSANRWLWECPGAYIALTSSASGYGTGKRPEFLKLTLVSVKFGREMFSGRGGITKSMSRRSELKDSVEEKDNGDRVIAGVPMVDQGRKGYCAVASAERVFRYYGLQVDQHAMAQIAQSSAQGGTNPDRMVASLKRVAGRTKTRLHVLYEIDHREAESDIKAYNRVVKKTRLAPEFPMSSGYFSFQQFLSVCHPATLKAVRSKGTNYDRFKKAIHDKIDEGIPLLWALQVGVIKEKGIPQAGGGHMRLIIGYNEKTDEIIYTDSWGPGHEYKRMKTPDAFAPSMHLITIKPSS